MSRVLLYCGDRGVPWAAPSGASSHLRGVAAALTAQGFEVEVATPRRSDDRGSIQVPSLEPHHEPPRRWPSWMRELGETWDARRLLRGSLSERGRPDWIWERHALNVDAAGRWATANQVPRMLELNAPLTLERSRYSRVRWPRRSSRIERASLCAADRVITVSTWLADWAVQQGCSPDRVRYIPNGTSLKPSEKRGETRARLGLEGQVLGFVGGLRPWHGLRLFAPLLEALPKAQLLVVGQGPCPPPDHPRLHHIPWVEHADLAPLIAAMDVALAPYDEDVAPWFGPLKIPDYHSQGVPIVASTYGDLVERVGERGVCVPKLEPHAWAQAVRSVEEARFAPEVRGWVQVVEESLDGFTRPER